MRIASIAHAVFAVTMIALGAVGLFHRDFLPLWNPIPVSGPAGSLLIYLSAFISLASGIGLLIKSMAAIAARLLLSTLSLWLLLFRLPNFLLEPAFGACWSVFPLVVMLAATWVLYVWFAADWDHKYLSFVGSNNGLRVARVLYGLCLIFFGVAHFIDAKDTVSLIPHWLPGHLFWAYFTGCAFIAAGLATPSDSVRGWPSLSRPCKSGCSCSWCGYLSWQQAPKIRFSGVRPSLTWRSWLALGWLRTPTAVP